MARNQQKKVAAYIRVSGPGQVGEDAFGPDIQRNAISAFAVSQGWEIVETYEDLSVTGTVLERPALQRMIEDGEEGKYDVVLVHKIDRMSRSLKELLKLVEDILEPMGIALKSVTESFVDTSSPEGKAMFQMLGSFSELDKNQLVRKLKSGRIEKHERGGFSVGQVATGYQSMDGKLVVQDDWAEVVKRIYQMALQGDGVNRIARILNDEGVTTKNGCRFYARTVKLILTNRTYTGIVKH
jgi:site-specific DNA recombinase